MIKMTRVYGDMYVPREYCTFTNPVTSGGTEEVDYVDMPCENGCEKECENCTLQKIMNEYARLTRQDIDEKKRHCEECENYKEMSGMVYEKGTWSVCATTAMRQCMDTGNQRRKKL